MKTCIVLGDRSDIAAQLIPMLELDGWTIRRWNRDSVNLYQMPRWDLILCAIGQIKPVGFWAYMLPEHWDSAIESNVLLPVRLVRALWAKHEPNSSVCFMAGANPQKPMENYSAYSVGKMALLKAVEHLDLESVDCKFFALAPGTVLTKIHQATDDSGVRNAVLDRVRAENSSTPIRRIYECLKWCVKQPKEVIGGRNICVSDSADWEAENELPRMLQGNPNLYKLRRVE